MFVFLPLVLSGSVLATRLGQRAVVGWLVVSSIGFYAWWIPAYTPVLIVSVAANYMLGMWVARNRSGWTLAIGIAFNLGFLFFFKYMAFVTGEIESATGWSVAVAKIALPLGISFFTFQQIAYLVDTRDRRVVPHDWLHYAMFVMFFPQLIAGPIVHQAQILPQVTRGIRLVSRNVAVGMTIFAVGLFKKVVLAESMGAFSSPMFDAAAAGYAVTFLEAWGGAVAFTFQIYFDFSGYSDMAIGLARLFGIRLPANFSAPLRATGIIEFWRRWHMTLTSFVQSYVFNPLSLRATRQLMIAGSPADPASIRAPAAFIRILALPAFITMFLVGIWHGAGWNFVVFGLMHASMIVINHLWRAGNRHAQWRQYIPGFVRTGSSWATMFTCVALSLVLFRAQDLPTAINIFTGMLGQDGRMVVTIGYFPVLQKIAFLFGEVRFSEAALLYYAGREQILWLVAGLAAVLVLPTTQEIMGRYRPIYGTVENRTGWAPDWLRWRPTWYWAIFVIAAIALSLVIGLQPTEFLYFQF